MALRWSYISTFHGLLALVLIPRMRKLAIVRSYVSPTDIILDRFRSPTLHIVVSTCAALMLVCYVTAQFAAISNTFDGLYDGAVPGIYGAVGMGAIMVVSPACVNTPR